MSLREARFFKGLNQWDISVKTGVPQSKLSLVERGYIDLREDEKKKIAKVLNCKVADIFPDNKRLNDE